MTSLAKPKRDGDGRLVVAETRDFKAYVRPSQFLETMKGEQCYAVLNKRTGVVEVEGNSEAMMIRGVYSLQEQLDKAMLDPENAEGKAEQDRIMALLAGEGVEGGGSSGPATPTFN